MPAVHLTEENFEQEVIQSDVPALVDFWAEWCGPCKMIGPVIEEIAEEFNGKLKVAKVNVDEAQGLAMKYSVMSIPTLILFKGGEAVDQMVGVAGKGQLIEKINQVLT